MSLLAQRLADLPGPDLAASAAVEERTAQVLRPSGALQWLDDVAAWKAGWQRSHRPTVERPAALVFAADHGVAAAGVSNYPAEITASMLAATQQSKATINAFAHTIGATVTAVDVGVGEPTNDMRHEAALSPERFDEITQVAFDAVDALDTDLLVLGELGIGNTTAAAAIAAAFAGGEAAVWVGRGTGIDDAGLERKKTAVQESVRRIAGVVDPLEILREVGGSELVAMAAATVAARHRSIPIVLDGYICTSSVLPLHRADPAALDHCIVGHCSAEPGHRKLLDAMGKKPLLDLDMRLGEGTGAMAAVPIVKMACAGVVEVATFDEWFGSE
ncbi:nicotinate-nucleotide--dimethylbenzimidazole phosphoribosyltransferase [Ilumatobacter coccineus]|uniref:Nicotinate-nucleotide--dimethylbenzimidazole phosphoribosyltransferase n=1 Tax=Ilumatobacter coccineus (strain NBRC 103263 / KCTC 29153 / YM16-304) TaxID=1313172 RepID=A0A6C7E4B8_ILUCY|nr:nicotinate-nucleotide--dimethylbenzimidazole phosphoribosyltransferase [Ilumatobacter coccineus]BAN01471.1 nicotinate-nucleotide--dimethylbenzimidazole phosphoribosyltransferase [Ilumatobacter coccineus YM16-304]